MFKKTFQACKNFKDNDTCVTHCPTEMVYDPNMYEWVPNPNAKYAYGTMCVETCPCKYCGLIVVQYSEMSLQAFQNVLNFN